MSGTGKTALKRKPRGPAARPLGAHMSIAGGLSLAVERAASVRATALQIFTKNQLQWDGPHPSAGDVAAFRQAVETSRLRFVCAHAGYLINLASPESAIHERSLAAMVDEVRRAEALGCSGVVLHPGSHKRSGRAAGIARLVAALAEVLAATTDCQADILVENTAGQGDCLGGRFEELAEIFERLDWHPRLGLCLDTCHAFAAGIDLRTPQAVAAAAAEIESLFGMARLRVLHLNDCCHGLGCKLDRHAHIGAGKIGRAGFAAILHEPRFRGIPGIIETPKDWKTLAEDRTNLNRLRRLEGGTAGSRS